mgnify:CR=1 FL=1
MTDNDKKKQIEEMAEFIHVDSSFLGYEEDALRLAEELYKAGYRKQIEGEWIESVELKTNLLKSCTRKEKTYCCPHCGRVYRQRMNYCGHCGVKMKGGESDA